MVIAGVKREVLSTPVAIGAWDLSDGKGGTQEAGHSPEIGVHHGQKVLCSSKKCKAVARDMK